jgi:uncharacterized GH25 family protein
MWYNNGNLLLIAVTIISDSGGGMFMNWFHDTTDKMVYGHEAWLEPAETHCHTGGQAEVLVKWGHNMKPEGLCRKENLKAMVLYPDGEKVTVPVSEGGQDYYTLRFAVPVEGYYHVVLENNGDYILDQDYQYHEGSRREFPQAAHAIHYLQYAQAFIRVGHDPEGTVRRAATQLELAPVAWKQWRKGEEVPLRLEFRGQALPDEVLDVIYSLNDVYKVWKESAGEGGVLKLHADRPGYYLAVARREVQEKQEGVYDTLSLTATLSFMVVK